ncbi:2-keto-4-pentenoate hydratase/2-oxohepta-3-ene-1,7-dioic acid hydratase [Caulobacter sp. AP07]|uniref:fumarylacetoacetate hydrolase family protein n=1 Tax=Caulobacter sp. AP07 TaxID=1144304 RepID=UPI00027206BE|nr:fumarylacetoacetate hydrolase family protein [Caulobacter sp. AP07]EJL33715.1 2-keto-4-pentenoate hydratase/2-oxohepta-3-ene-1,7-dioic acid hydratase [Caulobacter sp. AP07]
MTHFAFPPPAPSTVPVEGGDVVFPVRRILCVGRNYAAHRREMGGDERDPPFFFAKPADAVVALLGPGNVPYPSATHDLHHEIELVVALKSGGAGIAVEAAMDHVFGYAVGVDLTRRDLQAAAKAKGQPWDAAKGFDASAPISAIRPVDKASVDGAIRLSVNGQERQVGQIADMIWTIPEIIAEASKLWTLAAGDLIFTGTPEGVAAIGRGDRVEGAVEGVGQLDFTIV